MHVSHFKTTSYIQMYGLVQCFSSLVLVPNDAHFVCLPDLTHPGPGVSSDELMS